MFQSTYDFYEKPLRHATSEQLGDFKSGLNETAAKANCTWNGEIWHDVMQLGRGWSWELYKGGDLGYDVMLEFAPAASVLRLEGPCKVLVSSMATIAVILSQVELRLSALSCTRPLAGQ